MQCQAFWTRSLCKVQTLLAVLFCVLLFVFCAAGLRLRGLLLQVLGRFHPGRLVGEEVEGATGAHARPARACYLSGFCRIGKSALLSVNFIIAPLPVHWDVRPTP